MWFFDNSTPGGEQDSLAISARTAPGWLRHENRSQPGIALGKI
jgi:hypothetical protein